MAVIHKSKSTLQRDKRAAWLLMVLGWPIALLAAGLTVFFYMECHPWLIRQAAQWQEAFVNWAVAPREALTFAQEWQEQINLVVTVVLRGVGWGIYGLTLAFPALMGLGLTLLFARLQRPAARRCRPPRLRLQGEQAALALVRQMPGSCHVFLNKRLVFSGGTSEMDMVLVGPGGVAVMDVRSYSGLIEGVVNEQVLYRKRQDGSVEKLRNPARQVVGHVTRLGNYLRSQGLNVFVLPCVLFPDPEASVYVTVPQELFINERRTLISSCVMMDAQNFWELMGRDFAAGHQLTQGMVEQIVTVLKKAPAGKKRR